LMDINQPAFTRVMLGYALWVTIEDSLRNWLAQRLILLFGHEWQNQIPAGVWNNLQERYDGQIKQGDIEQVRDLLEHSDFPDIFGIVIYRKKQRDFLPSISVEDINYYNNKLYTLRNNIAHKPHSFSARQLDDLLDCSTWVRSIIGPGADSDNIQKVQVGIEKQPELFAVAIPDKFVASVKVANRYKFTNNLPPMDYELDGGFVGRREEKKGIKAKLLDKRINPVITISGAGGVGKTALAHFICDDLLTHEPDSFDGLIWISAKKEKLTLTGIEEIEPVAQTFEEVLNAILTTFGFTEYLDSELTIKRQVVQEVVIDDQKHSILLVIDNLETIQHDKALVEYLKDIPLPHKVLITSRLGLGEIERRIPLKEMSEGDAVELFRLIAVEKSAKQLARLPSDTIKTYVERMSGYPLVIKWVVGQAAGGKDIERLVQSINSTDSDISKFCFEYIYDHMLSENAKLVLHSLAASEEELTQAALMHVAELSALDFEDVLLELELASLVIPIQEKDVTQHKIITRYSILPLTRAYLTSKGDSGRDVKARIQGVQTLVENARRAKREYELSLEYFGAESNEELIATKYIQTAFTRSQAKDYDGAIEALKRAADITPNFAAVYRSWAVIERNNGNLPRANELFEKAANLNANDAPTWFNWGKLQKNLLNYELARRYLNKALELVEDKATVLLALANVEKQDLNYREAIDLFEQAIKYSAGAPSTAFAERQAVIIYTSLADTYRRWAETYERSKQYETAIEKVTIAYGIIEKFINVNVYTDLKPQEVFMECGVLLGELHKRISKPEEAEKFLNEVVSTPFKAWSPRQKYVYCRACYLLIPILLAKGEANLAKDVYSRGLGHIAITKENFRRRYENLEPLIVSNRRYEGVVMSVFPDRGYSFISADEVKQPVFAHINDFVDELDTNDFAELKNIWVSFTLEQRDKGPAARTIQILP
jgi:LuxR family transcriptional regulator, glucitol operon activator